MKGSTTYKHSMTTVNRSGLVESSGLCADQARLIVDLSVQLRKREQELETLTQELARVNAILYVLWIVLLVLVYFLYRVLGL